MSEQAYTNNNFTSLKLLLVDDASFVRGISAKILRDMGFAKVLEAENGVEAVSILNTNEVDLLVTDIQMPEMNGLELIKQIRTGNTCRDRGLLTIVETSFSNAEVIGSCLALDINGFLVKPFNPERVKNKICSALAEHKSLRPAVVYQSVKTDLESLASMGKEKLKTTNNINRHVLLRHDGPDDKQVEITKLKPGMKLLEDMNTNSGMPMVEAGRVLNEGLINRVLELKEIVHEKVVWVRLS
jgi:CheY-like chemotaxis protein